MEDNSLQQDIRMLVVDDQRLMRDGIASLLSIQEGMEVVGTASNGKEALDQRGDRQKPYFQYSQPSRFKRSYPGGHLCKGIWFALKHLLIAVYTWNYVIIQV